jgi:hypothetical protein
LRVLPGIDSGGKMSEPIKATHIGLGQLSKRKYVGRYYAAESGYSTKGQGHATLQCKFVRENIEYDRLPMYESEDGSLYFYTGGERGERHIKATLCEQCPDYIPSGWREEGKCFDSHDDRSMSFKPKDYDGFIEDYCSTCPVTRECFEYAANYEMSGTWGGVHIPQDYSRRKKVIEKTRRKLGL